MQETCRRMKHRVVACGTHRHTPSTLHIWEQQSAGLAQLFPAPKQVETGGDRRAVDGGLMMTAAGGGAVGPA